MEPDLTRIEFTAADLPDEPPAQDPGPLGDAVAGQAEQQQQAAFMAIKAAEEAPAGSAGTAFMAIKAGGSTC